MKISTRHQCLSNRLKNPRVLDYPEEFLGPNWKADLNFWVYLDTLTDEQWEVIEKRHWDMTYYDEFNAAYYVAKEAVKKTTSYWQNVYYAACGYLSAGNATWELIASHELLNQQKPFIFLSLFLNL